MIKFFSTSPREGTIHSIIGALPEEKAIEELIKQNALMRYFTFAEKQVPTMLRDFKENLDSVSERYLTRGKSKTERDELGRRILKTLRGNAKFFSADFHKYWVTYTDSEEDLIPYSREMFSFIDLFQFNADSVAFTPLLFEMAGEHVSNGPCIYLKPTQLYSVEVSKPGEILAEGPMTLVKALSKRKTLLNLEALLLILSGTCVVPHLPMHGQVSPSFVAKSIVVFGGPNCRTLLGTTCRDLMSVFDSPYTKSDSKPLEEVLIKMGCYPAGDSDDTETNWHPDSSVTTEADEETPEEEGEESAENQDNIEDDESSEPVDENNNESTDTAGDEEEEEDEEPVSLSSIKIDFKLEEKATIESHAYKTQVNEFLSHVLKNPHLYSGTQCLVARALSNCWLFYLSESTVKAILKQIF